MLGECLIWVGVVAATVTNLWFLFQRWSAPPLSQLPTAISEQAISGLVVGFSVGIVLVNLFKHVLSKRWTNFIVLALLSVGLMWCCADWSCVGRIKGQSTFLALVGCAVAAVAASGSDRALSGDTSRGFRAFCLYAIGVFNFFLVVGPYTTFLPGYYQGERFSISRLSFTAVDTGPCLFYLLMTRFFEALLGAPSINSSVITSNLLVSVGLASAALGVRLVFGTLWGWLFLAYAVTDTWLIAGAMSSSVVCMPIVVVGTVTLLCLWAIRRPYGLLSYREAWGLGFFTAANLFFALYSYTPARIPLFAGYLVAGVILILRGAVGLSRPALTSIGMAAAPSVALIFVLLIVLFGGNVRSMTDLVLRSPKSMNVITHVDDYPEKVQIQRETDQPIWWASGRVESTKITVYWRRSVPEILHELRLLLKDVRVSSIYPEHLIILALVACAVGLAGSSPSVRGFCLVTFLGAIGSFSAFILGQDLAAYRRALGTGLLIDAALIGLFASMAGRRSRKLVAVVLACFFCLVQVPYRLAPMLTASLHVDLALYCLDLFQARELLNSSVFKGANSNRMLFVADDTEAGVHYRRCMLSAFNSYEWKQMAPNAAILEAKGRGFQEIFEGLSSGEVLVVSCPATPSNNSELKQLCSTQPHFGHWLGTIIDPDDLHKKRPKWVFIQKD